MLRSVVRLSVCMSAIHLRPAKGIVDKVPFKEHFYGPKKH